MAEEPTTTNRLSQESSPYLLQHQHNPVDWYPWGDEALSKAQKEDKPLLISIGYSACHWCHVMERECFENETLAAQMNQGFVSIKVDREERPDVDALYMEASQAMNGHGGWPLNVFATPDGRPFFAGTYFPSEQWSQVLKGVRHAWETKREEVEKSADELHSALQRDAFAQLKPQSETFVRSTLEEALQTMKGRFDKVEGGVGQPPKFPLPISWWALLRMGYAFQDKETLRHTRHTLEAIARGGIHDHVGGGFARYSTDAEWFAPHFEKMLYDNAQLLGLYAEAWQYFGDPLFREAAYQLVDWLQREMTSPEGAFYSALDADSEGQEGKYYTWTYEELQSLLGADFQDFASFFHLEQEGNWEGGRNILCLEENYQSLAERLGREPQAIQEQIRKWKGILLEKRNQRIRPGLDDKVLVSWNALMVSGLCRAYRVFGEEKWLQLARDNMRFLQQQCQQGANLLHTYKNGEAKITGFLEDYAAVVEALLELHEATLEPHYLEEAGRLSETVLAQFDDPEDQLFYFTPADGEALVARKKEVMDNVIPASNSIMIRNLFRLGHLLDRPEWLERAHQATKRMQKLIKAELAHSANWAELWLEMLLEPAEVALAGPEAPQKRAELEGEYFPFKLLTGSPEPSDLPLLKGRYPESGQTLFYVCFGKACQKPTADAEDALEQLKMPLQGFAMEKQ